jgi:hypothetical protein
MNYTNTPKYEFYISKLNEQGALVSEDTPVYANSEAELHQLYSLTGDKIMINRTNINPKYVVPNHPANSSVKKPVKSPPPPTPVSSKSSLDSVLSNIPGTDSAGTIDEQFQGSDAHIPTGILKEKIYTIGNDRYKINTLSGKFYVEKWVKLDEETDPKIRVMYDTGKSVQMTGKHLEILKWVEVEHEG